MGLHGSSTTPLILQDAQVPAANLLGEIGKGHKVAFNVLNFGRYKLGAMCVGGATCAIGESARYAATRRQFGKPIADVRRDQAQAWRDDRADLRHREPALPNRRAHRRLDRSRPADRARCSRPWRSLRSKRRSRKWPEARRCDFVLDENVQIHGGNGFVKDYPAERHYRDARVNRIFEGTNEINRLLIPGMLIRRALKGDLPLIPAARKLQDEILAGPARSRRAGTARSAIRRPPCRRSRRSRSCRSGWRMQRYGDELTEQQEVLIGIADIVDRRRVRGKRAASGIVSPGSAMAPFHVDAASIFINDAASRVEASARQVLAAMTEGDTLRTHLAALQAVAQGHAD